MFGGGLIAAALCSGNLGGGISGKLRGINGSDTITISYDVPDEKDPKKTVTKTVEYTCEIFTFTDEIKTTSTITNGEETTTTTSVESFSKLIITSISNNNGDVILTTDYDENTGEIYGYYDSDNKKIEI